MWCDGCRQEVLASWELGDGSRLCHACIVEQTAIAEGHATNAAVLAARTEWATPLLDRIHLSGHGYPREACPICANDERILR